MKILGTLDLGWNEDAKELVCKVAHDTGLPGLEFEV